VIQAEIWIMDLALFLTKLRIAAQTFDVALKDIKKRDFSIMRVKT
jgi:hypothetical protein